MFYYAKVNNNNFVVELVQSETEITDSSYISITQDQYTDGDLMWLYYNPSTGEIGDCDNWIGSCDWIFYKDSGRPITPKFDDIDSKIVALETALPTKADVIHSHTLNGITETDSQKIMTAAERTKLSGIAENANLYVHPASHSSSMITGLSSVATSGSYDDLSNKPTSFNPASHTHAQSEITGLTSALNGKANASHTHNDLYISKNLQPTNDGGGTKYSFSADSGVNVLEEISDMPGGIHTIYAAAALAGNPKTTEGWRFFVHKSAPTYGWIQAFGSSGSYYVNYQYGDNAFRGWVCVYDAAPVALWNGENNGTGGYIMNATHTVTPSKPLSKCKGGWLLLWADYDPDTKTFNDYDFCTTLIPRVKPNNSQWSGQPHLCAVASYLKNSTPYDSETIRVKTVHVYNDKLTGHAANVGDGRNDIVLRSIYEF